MLDHWALIDADLQDAGIDTASGILTERTGAWLRHRIAGLLWTDSRLARALRPPEGK